MRDPGLVEITNWQHWFVKARLESLRQAGVAAEEVDRERPIVTAQAAAIANAMRDDYLRRTQ